MTAQDVINIARERLGDEKEQRWSSFRMLSLVSQGQLDICERTGYYRQEKVIPLVDGTTRYKLPEDCLTLRRVEYKGDKIPLHTRNDRDGNRPRISGTDFVAIKSNLNHAFVEIFPEVPTLEDVADIRKGVATDSTINVVPLFGVVTSISDPNTAVNPVFGVVTDITMDYDELEPSDKYGEIVDTSLHEISTVYPNGQFGVTVGLEFTPNQRVYLGFIVGSPNYEVSGKFGVTVALTNLNNSMRVYYTAMPTKLKSQGELLVLPDMWEAMLVRYVVGTALQDDNDANNIQRGELELQKYNTAVVDLEDKAAKDFSANADDKYETEYRSI